VAGFIEVLVRALASSGAAVHEVALASAASAQDAWCLFAVGGQAGENLLAESRGWRGQLTARGSSGRGGDGRATTRQGPRRGYARPVEPPGRITSSNRPVEPHLPTARSNRTFQRPPRVLTMGPMKLLLPAPPQRRPARTSPGSLPGGVCHDSYCP